MVACLLVYILSAVFALGWIAASVHALVMNLIFSAYVLLRRDMLMATLMVFGLVAGFAELFSDHYAIVTGSLVYPKEGPFLWTSPLYMPFSWVFTFAQLGYLAVYIRQRNGLVLSIIAMAFIGGSSIPIYEYLAKNAEFWYYQKVPMLWSSVPIYVIASEAFLAISLPFLAARLQPEKWALAALLGLIQGAWIYLGLRVALYLFG